MKKLINLLSILLVIMVLFGSISLCNQSTVDTKMYSIGTAGSGGTYYLIGGAIANILNTKGILNVTAEATAGANENIVLLDEKTIEFGIATADIIELAYKGMNPFNKPYYTIKVVCALYPNVFQIIVPAESNIKTVNDLKGKRISVGAPGSGTEITIKKRLLDLGISYDDIKPEFLTFADNASAMSSGNIDAALVETSAPTSFALEYESQRALRLISLNQTQIDDIMEVNPAMAPITIPPKTYSSFNQSVETVATYGFLITREDIPAEIVYKLVKAINENLDELKDVHFAAKMIEPTSIGISPISFHAGSERYFKEIGVME